MLSSGLKIGESAANPFSFSRQSRLLTAGDFRRVFDQAELKVSDKHLLILARSNSLNHPRLGFVISKKNVRRAVNRNRVRRMMRESFRLHQHQLPDYDLVVLARKGIDQLEAAQLSALLSKSWKRLINKADRVQQSH